MRWVCGHVSTGSIESKRGICPHREQRGLPGFNARRRNHVATYADTQVHFDTLLTGTGEVPAGRRNVVRVAGGVEASQFGGQLVYLDFVPFGRRLVQCFAATAVAAVDRRQFRHQRVHDDLTDNTDDSATISRERYHPTLTAVDTTALYTYFLYTFEGVELTDDTIVGYIDIYYGLTPDYGESPMADLRLYHRDDPKRELQLTGKEEKALAAFGK